MRPTGRWYAPWHSGIRRRGFYEGRHRAAYWDGRNGQGELVASGVYFYHLSAGDYSATRRNGNPQVGMLAGETEFFLQNSVSEVICQSIVSDIE